MTEKLTCGRLSTCELCSRCLLHLPLHGGRRFESTHVLHMTRLHAKRPLLVELRVINGPFEGGCRLQSGAGAWLACNTSREDRSFYKKCFPVTHTRNHDHPQLGCITPT